MKRSTCASGSAYVPSDSIGFCVAITRNGRGDDKGLQADRDLSLLHHLEQRRLDLGRRAVDLVGEDEVGEDRPALGVELAAVGPEDARADEVGGHEVGRELDAVERAVDDVGEGLDGERLGQAGHAFEQDVAVGQQCHQQSLEQHVLADDDAADLEQHGLAKLAGVGVIGLGGGRRVRSRRLDHGEKSSSRTIAGMDEPR